MCASRRMKRYSTVLVLLFAGLFGVTIYVLHLRRLPWLTGFGVVLILAPMVYRRYVAYQFQKRRGIELPAPFSAEVVLDGRTVAIVSDRRITEMFWRDYRIEAVDEIGLRAISNDELWESGRFVFRESTSGTLCDSAFAGGSRPFVRDSRVSIRGMYFKTRPNKALQPTAAAPASCD